MSSSSFFIRATEEDRWWTEREKTKEDTGETRLSGEEARDFYQSLFREEGGNGRRERKEDRKERRQRRGRRGPAGRPSSSGGGGDGVSERDGHRLLRSAQDGDVRTLKELLERGCDVNFCDRFYWTALMCASHAGQRDAVRLLLGRGAAWVGVVDTQGRDARSLALQAGHQDVVSELERFGVTGHPSAPADRGHSPRWCEVCGVSYTDGAHTHSTLHQFSVKRPPAAPQYCLPESSAGYRMMLRSGWDPHRGLGPSHSGRKHPVGTVLKRDSVGLGFGPPQRPRVTHFQAKDPQAVRRTETSRRRASLTVKEMKRREERERNWERNFRSSFNINT